jgi:hypothetical protein
MRVYGGRKVANTRFGLTLMASWTSIQVSTARRQAFMVATGPQSFPAPPTHLLACPNGTPPRARLQWAGERAPEKKAARIRSRAGTRCRERQLGTGGGARLLREVGRRQSKWLTVSGLPPPNP